MSYYASCRMEAWRGGSTEAPENTLPAFRLSAEQGCDDVELDPRFARDHVCALMHDRTLNLAGRLNDRPLPEEMAASEMDLSALREIDVGLWKDVRFAGTRIPAPAEALAFAEEGGVGLKLDNVAESFSPEQKRLFFEQLRGSRAQIGIIGARLDYLRETAQAVPNAAPHYAIPSARKRWRRLRGWPAGASVTSGCGMTARLPPGILPFPCPPRWRRRSSGMPVWAYGFCPPKRRPGGPSRWARICWKPTASSSPSADGKAGLCRKKSKNMPQALSKCVKIG